jgi:N-acetyl-beta-hexosaminidase
MVGTTTGFAFAAFVITAVATANTDTHSNPVASDAEAPQTPSSTSDSTDLVASSPPWWRREHLLPAPASVTLSSGRLRLQKGGLTLASVGLQSSIVDAALARLPALLFGASVTQCRLPPCNATRSCNATSELGKLHTLQVNVTQTGGNWSGLAHGSDESYRLQISSAGVASVTAPTASGAVYGLETFAQLVKIGFDGVVAICSAPLVITDAPRFGWRGMMVDSSRHFLPITLLLKMIDALSATKGNVLHWHFMDGQSFPMVSEQFPGAHLVYLPERSHGNDCYR